MPRCTCLHHLVVWHGNGMMWCDLTWPEGKFLNFACTLHFLPSHGFIFMAWLISVAFLLFPVHDPVFFFFFPHKEVPSPEQQEPKKKKKKSNYNFQSRSTSTSIRTGFRLASMSPSAISIASSFSYLFLPFFLYFLFVSRSLPFDRYTITSHLGPVSSKKSCPNRIMTDVECGLFSYSIEYDCCVPASSIAIDFLHFYEFLFSLFFIFNASRSLKITCASEALRFYFILDSFPDFFLSIILYYFFGEPHHWSVFIIGSCSAERVAELERRIYSSWIVLIIHILRN